jgi:hypothetical protein
MIIAIIAPEDHSRQMLFDPGTLRPVQQNASFEDCRQDASRTMKKGSSATKR